jgi:hypothetical protein
LIDSKRVIIKTVQTKIPEELYKEVALLIKEGWFRDEEELFSEAL